jgi:hypothetical protein
MKSFQNRDVKIIKVLTVSSGFKKIDFEDKAYWFSQNPNNRIQYIEILRKINYGKDASRRLQRILEVAKRA